MFVLNEKAQSLNKAVIKIVGVGGGGCNTIDYMVEYPIGGVDLLAFNTDAQSLEKSRLRESSSNGCLQIGQNVTRGLGAGRIVQVGKEAATENRDSIQNLLAGADMVFVAAGMGGGTGSGAAPVVAEIARAQGSLTVAVVTKPFHVEGEVRMRIAEQGIEELSKHVDSLITIPNEKLLGVLDSDVLMSEACAEVDKVMHNAVQGIAELITCKGQFNNLDFADVKTIMSGTGVARIGVGVASGENRAHEAAHSAISNPLLDDVHLANVGGMLVNITAGDNFRLKEYHEISECMKDLAATNADIMIGTVMDNTLEDEIHVTLVATGLEAEADLDNGAVNAKMSSVSTGNHFAQPEMVPMDLNLELPVSDKIVSLNAASSIANPANMSAHRQSNLDVPANEAVEMQERHDRSSDYLDIPAFLRRQAD